MTRPAYQGFDPATSYTSDQFAVLRLLQRTLLTYRGLPGYDGTVPVPDLASGPPDVSADGLTWTFHIRPGVHYAPPLQDTEVTAGDFVRAFERIPVGYGPGTETMPSILDGFQAFADGESSSIAGVRALDDHTLQLRTTRPDRTLAQLVAQPYTAPIPPSPRSHSPLGIATGHDFTFNDARPWAGPLAEGFGPFQSATGPYMIEGADRIDYLKPPSQQGLPTGFTPSWWFLDDGQGHTNQPGLLVLVRNPSWDPGSDPARPAYVDRIEITIQPWSDPYRQLEADKFDTVIGDAPSARFLNAAASDARSRIERIDGNGVDWVLLNLAQPPFDDIAVRRAFSLALDRDAMTTAYAAATGSTTQDHVTSHIVPDSLVAGLLAGWSPTHGDPRAQMQRSVYWGPAGCRAQACRPVKVGGYQVPDPGVQAVLRRTMRTMGLRPVFVGWDNDPRSNCMDPANHFAVCVVGWLTDYPDASSMFSPFLVSPSSGSSATGLSMTDQQLRAAGSSARALPDVTDDIARCAAALPAVAVPCWAQLDQWLTDKLVTVVPFCGLQSVRVHGSRVTSFLIDQSTGEVALARVAVS